MGLTPSREDDAPAAASAAPAMASTARASVRGPSSSAAAAAAAAAAASLSPESSRMAAGGRPVARGVSEVAPFVTPPTSPTPPRARAAHAAAPRAAHAAAAPSGRSAGRTRAPPAAASAEAAPAAVVVRWPRGGGEVAVEGSWDAWRAQVPLSRSSGNFTTILDLAPGTYWLRFRVDGRVALDDSLRTEIAPDGRPANVLVVAEVAQSSIMDSDESDAFALDTPPGSYAQIIPTYAESAWAVPADPLLPPLLAADLARSPPRFDPASASLPPYAATPLAVAGAAAAAPMLAGPLGPAGSAASSALNAPGAGGGGGVGAGGGGGGGAAGSAEPAQMAAANAAAAGGPFAYDNKTPKTADSGEPPSLPHHLLRPLLNSRQSDPSVLPIPHYVTLQHVAVQHSDPGTVVLGTTQRYRKKFFTTVFVRAVDEE